MARTYTETTFDLCSDEVVAGGTSMSASARLKLIANSISSKISKLQVVTNDIDIDADSGGIRIVYKDCPDFGVHISVSANEPTGTSMVTKSHSIYGYETYKKSDGEWVDLSNPIFSYSSFGPIYQYINDELIRTRLGSVISLNFRERFIDGFSVMDIWFVNTTTGGSGWKWPDYAACAFGMATVVDYFTNQTKNVGLVALAKQGMWSAPMLFVPETLSDGDLDSYSFHPMGGTSYPNNGMAIASAIYLTHGEQYGYIVAKDFAYTVYVNNSSGAANNTEKPGSIFTLGGHKFVYMLPYIHIRLS